MYNTNNKHVRVVFCVPKTSFNTYNHFNKFVESKESFLEEFKTNDIIENVIDLQNSQLHNTYLVKQNIIAFYFDETEAPFVSGKKDEYDKD